MTKKTKRASDVVEHFETLKPFMAKVAKGSFKRHTLFSLCVKASAIKCFEFNLTARRVAELKLAFFEMSSLRGMCEDLIVLRCVGGMPPEDRQKLLAALMSHELATRTSLQDEFFRAIRPQQPVLRMKNADAALAASEAAAREVWNRHGWAKLQKGAMPQIRQIAEKQGLHQLAVLYDYLYRLTSAGVHFNVQSLLRSGWGKNPENEFEFSAKNFHEYFAAYCSLYGAFVFCLYFEFFRSVLRPQAKEKLIVEKIREQVLSMPRWPEMVTYEEMNQRPPEDGRIARLIVTYVQAASRKRLISKGVDYRNKRSGERRSVAKMLRLVADGGAAASQKIERAASSNRAEGNRSKRENP